MSAKLHRRSAKSSLETKKNIQRIPNTSCRYFTEVPHFPGSEENYDLAKYIKNKWKGYGFTSSKLKKYIVMLSRPTKPGFVAMYDGSNQEIYRSAAQETFLVPSENNSKVVTPFNAYAPSGSVRVSDIYVDRSTS